MLAVVYLTLTARPLSLRRLLLLFVFALMAANLMFAAFHVRHGPHAALVTAAAVTLFVWIAPVVRLAYYAIRFRVLVLEVLCPVSDFMCQTYGFVLTLVPMLAIAAIFAPEHHLRLAVLPGVMITAGLGGLVLQTWVGRWNRRVRPRRLRNDLGVAHPSRRRMPTLRA